MTSKSVLIRPQGLRLRARAPTYPLLLRHWLGHTKYFANGIATASLLNVHH